MKAESTNCTLRHIVQSKKRNLFNDFVFLTSSPSLEYVYFKRFPFGCETFRILCFMFHFERLNKCEKILHHTSKLVIDTRGIDI